MLMKATIKGTAPLIMNNGRGADPSRSDVQALKALNSSKKSKDRTTDDYDLIGRHEMAIKLYTNADGVPYVPSLNIEAAIINGAKKTKSGKIASAGLRVIDAGPLVYDGPTDFEGLCNDPRHVFRCGFKQMGQRIYKVRPIFPEWEQSFTVQYDPHIVDANSLVQWIKAAGTFAGLGDWRPRHGTFELIAHETMRDASDDLLDGVQGNDDAANDDDDENAAA